MDHYLQPDVRVKIARRLKRILRLQSERKVRPAVRAKLQLRLKEASRKGSLSLDENSFRVAVDEMIALGAITNGQFIELVREVCGAKPKPGDTGADSDYLPGSSICV